MIRQIFTIIVMFVCGFGVTSNAQTTGKQGVQVPGERLSDMRSSRVKSKHGFVEIGMSYMLLQQQENDNLSCIGVKLGGGFYPVGDFTRLGIEVAIQGAVNNPVIGSFSYTQQQGSGPQTSHDDGVIKRTMMFFPILVNWDFEFGKKTMFRIGPSIGLVPTSSKNEFEPIPDNSKEYINKQVKAPFVYGGNAELSFGLKSGVRLNFGYKYLRFTPFTLKNGDVSQMSILYDSPVNELKLTGHQISVGILFGF